LLQETFDAKGNHIIYEYKSENTENVAETISESNRCQTSNKYIKTIKYGKIIAVFRRTNASTNMAF
jgi:hypothetical protein